MLIVLIKKDPPGRILGLSRTMTEACFGNITKKPKEEKR